MLETVYSPKIPARLPRMHVLVQYQIPAHSPGEHFFERVELFAPNNVSVVQSTIQELALKPRFHTSILNLWNIQLAEARDFSLRVSTAPTPSGPWTQQADRVIRVEQAPHPLMPAELPPRQVRQFSRLRTRARPGVWSAPGATGRARLFSRLPMHRSLRFALALLLTTLGCGSPDHADGGCVTCIVDAGAVDAGSRDGGAPDAGRPDAGLPDAGVVDAGTGGGSGGGTGGGAGGGGGGSTGRAPLGEPCVGDTD
jgi:uncharacterized membrane protein YgcG